jgi:tetratricopeptide (TPR) repeat protein
MHCTDEELLGFVEAGRPVSQHVRSCAGCASRQAELQRKASGNTTPATGKSPATGARLARPESALERGADREAREILEAVIREGADEDLPMLGRLHHRLANVCVGTQDLEAAEKHFAEACSIFSRLDLAEELRVSAWGRAELLLRNDQFVAAISELGSLADDFEDADQLEQAGLCRLGLTEALLAQGEVQQAGRAMRAALENFRVIDPDHRATTALSYLHQTRQGGYGSRQAIERVRRFLATIGFGSPLRPAN